MLVDCEECQGSGLIYNAAYCCTQCGGEEETACEDCEGTGKYDPDADV